MATSDIDAMYRDKVLFVTGITGFVGKVFLFKLLKEFPDVRKVYILLRSTKDKTCQQRLETEILSSQCFEYLRTAVGDQEFKLRCAKCVAVKGDLVEDRLGIAPDLYATIVQEIHFIVHLAATVDFNERLDVSAKLNTLGALRVLTLAKKAHTRKEEGNGPFLCHCHVSTCYVNWNRHSGVVSESVYPVPFPAEGMTKYILSLHPSEVERITPSLLAKHNFPNTYTLTKNLGEQLLCARAGNVPMFIARPSIIGCAWEDPTPGWVDTMSAATAILAGFCLGVVHEMHCNNELVADVIPVDYVVNGILLGLHQNAAGSALKPTPALPVPPMLPRTPQNSVDLLHGLSSRIKGRAPVLTTQNLLSASQAEFSDNLSQLSVAAQQSNQGSIPVYHFASSAGLNTMSWGLAQRVMMVYQAKYPSPKAIGSCHVYLTPNKLDYLARFKLKREYPHKVLKLAAKVPGLLSESTKKNVARYQKVIDRNKILQDNFTDFMMYEWRFDDTRTRGLLNSATQDQRRRFNVDTYDIVWTKYLERYFYGLRTFIVKDNNSAPTPEVAVSGSQLLVKSML
jgi:fatty acyl-CoA reductase